MAEKEFKKILNRLDKIEKRGQEQWIASVVSSLGSGLVFATLALVLYKANVVHIWITLALGVFLVFISVILFPVIRRIKCINGKKS